MIRVKGQSILDSYELIVEIEPSDIGKQFSLYAFHIPYSMGCGAVAVITYTEQKVKIPKEAE